MKNEIEKIKLEVFKKFYPAFELKPELRPMVPLCEVIDYLSEKGYLRDEWWPIETAPKTCENILVYRPVHDCSYIPVVGEDYWGTTMFNPEGCWMRSRQDCQPSHWMPLPNPPKGE
jgi:hypothetical protein